GGAVMLSLDRATDTSSAVDAALAAPSREQLLDLDAALDDLARLDARQARLVELRYFLGLSVEETAAVLSISDRTVKREWRSARLWLKQRLGT
ncbi:MAG: ECF-type sigma factor, partial [Acidobacteriota bacterium]